MQLQEPCKYIGFIKYAEAPQVLPLFELFLTKVTSKCSKQNFIWFNTGFRFRDTSAPDNLNRCWIWKELDSITDSILDTESIQCCWTATLRSQQSNQWPREGNLHSMCSTSLILKLETSYQSFVRISPTVHTQTLRPSLPRTLDLRFPLTFLLTHISTEKNSDSSCIINTCTAMQSS